MSEKNGDADADGGAGAGGEQGGSGVVPKGPLYPHALVGLSLSERKLMR